MNSLIYIQIIFLKKMSISLKKINMFNAIIT